MKRNKKAEFVLASTTYLLVCLLDLGLTYLATPNLYLEGNPLIDIISGGWPELIIINVVTFLGYIAMAYYAFVAYKPPVSKETDIRRYLADINYGDPDKTVPFMWKLPKNWGPQTACLCWAVCFALPICRLIIVIEWLLMVLHIHAPTFFSIVALFPAGRIDFFLAVPLAWALSFVWISLEYKSHMKAIQIPQIVDKAE